MKNRDLCKSNYNILLKGKEKLVVWNTLSDKMQVLEKGTFFYNFYIDNNELHESNLEDDDYSALYAQKLNGFLKEKNNEEAFKAEHKLISKRESDSLSAVITTTFSCNFNCSYCCQGTEKQPGVFGYEVSSKIVELWKESGKAKLNITWYGGEPLLFANKVINESTQIKSIVENLRGTYKAQIYTNGYLITSNIARKMVDAGITTVQVSIDGTRRTHDHSRQHRSGKPTFNKIFENIKNSIANNDNKLKFVIRINIEAEEVEISELISDLLSVDAHELGNTSFYLAPIEKRVGTSKMINSEELISKEKFSEFYRQFIFNSKKYNISYFIPNFSYGSCTATKEQSFVLAPNGDIHKCWDTVVLPTESFGSIKSEINPLKKIDETQKWRDFRASDHPKCAQCKLLPVCGGSCAIKHFTQDKTIDNQSNFHSACPPNKFLLKEYILDSLTTNSVNTNKAQEIYAADSFCDISLDSLSIEADKTRKTV